MIELENNKDIPLANEAGWIDDSFIGQRNPNIV